MDQQPLQGSKIELHFREGHQTIIMPQESPSIMRYYMGPFLILWLIFWLFTLVSEIWTILLGVGGVSSIISLGVWALGGVFVSYFLYRMFRRPIPEQFLLNRPNLTIDTGIPPYKLSFNPVYRENPWKMIFPKRRQLEFTVEELTSLRLRETDTGNRLTIDKEAERIDLAIPVTEVEKEWLFKYLQDAYSLSDS